MEKSKFKAHVDFRGSVPLRLKATVQPHAVAEGKHTTGFWERVLRYTEMLSEQFIQKIFLPKRI